MTNRLTAMRRPINSLLRDDFFSKGGAMKCDQCQSPIEKGDEREHAGKLLCEDCYMDALSCVKTCDPWAVYMASSMNRNDSALTDMQKKILTTLKETNGIELEPLADRLGIKLSQLEREIATLRHMEKLKAVKEGDKKIFRLW